MSDPSVSFEFFLEFFPEATLPMTVSEDTVRAISATMPPLNALLIETFLLPIEEAMVNEEFTEFVACFQLPPRKKDGHVSLVYWRADLLQYHYVLVTLNKQTAALIDRRVIAGTSYDGVEITQSSAAITDDQTIYIVSGQAAPVLGSTDYRAAASTAQRYQITEQGKIMEI